MALLLDVFYGIPASKKTRTRRLQVLCLGPSRTGTESLSAALTELGYDQTCHGYSVANNLSDLRCLSDLMAKKFNGELKRETPDQWREQFDAFLGDYVALTDMVGAIFAEELLEAYPDAQVVLNQRGEDGVEGWERSMLKTVIPAINDWKLWVVSWFDRELFWLVRCWNQEFRTFFDGSFERHGREVYRRHYQKAEERLKREKREYLAWKVQDSLAPLCGFLGKEVPRRPFPEGNTSAEFMKRQAERHARRIETAKRKAALFIVSLVVMGVASGLALYIRTLK